MTDREERQHVIEVLKQMRLDYEDFWEEINTEEIKAFNYAIASIETDLKYDLLYEETSGQEDKEADKPTTKNDLAVDCISRDSAIKALGYDIKSFEFKSGVSEYMDDIAKLLNTIYEIQVNNIKALPPVTPQESIEKCKWIKYDHRTMCPKEHDIDNPYWRIPENRMEALKYCPYCGKEIEVEE